MKNFIKAIIFTLGFMIVPNLTFADTQTSQPVTTLDLVQSGNITSGSGSSSMVVQLLNGSSTVGFRISNTFSAVLTPEVSLDGTNYTVVSAQPTSGGNPVQSITAPGQFTAPVGGFKYFAIVATSYTSGTVTVNMRASSANNTFSCSSGCIPGTYLESISPGLNMSQTGTASNPVLGTVPNPAFTSETLTNPLAIAYGGTGTNSLTSGCLESNGTIVLSVACSSIASTSISGTWTGNNAGSSTVNGFYSGSSSASDGPRAFAATNSNGNNSDVGPDSTHSSNGVTGTCWNWSQYSGSTFSTDLMSLDCSGNLGIAGAFHATTLYGSGAGISAASIPTSALQTTPLTSLVAGLNTSITGSAPSLTVGTVTNPTFTGLTTFGNRNSYGDYVIIANGYSGSGFTDISTNSARPASGINGSCLNIDVGGGSVLMNVDCSGNVGITGSMNAPTANFTQTTTLGSSGYETIHEYSSGCSGGDTVWLSDSRSVSTVAGSGFSIFCGGTEIYALDSSGDVGIAGSLHQASQRKLKNNINNYSDSDALKVIRSTKIVQYCYKSEKCRKNQEKHIGFIADDTSTSIAPGHKSMDIGSTASLALEGAKINDKEIQKLNSRLSEDENQIRVLEILIALFAIKVLFVKVKRIKVYNVKK